jgi:hypothetical protein
VTELQGWIIVSELALILVAIMGKGYEIRHGSLIVALLLGLPSLRIIGLAA